MRLILLQMLKCINEDKNKLRTIVKILANLIKKTIPKQQRGRRRCKLESAVIGIMYYLRTGCTWRALPVVFGKWKTIYGCKLGIFELLFIDLTKKLISKGKIGLF